mmetsp:Transcript_80989/g.212625  ORF Transcript_80989/g.212625 Transcript_80989/m.212625 type:complete len:252 (+) Transcript_80989:2251-3006(+)
MHVAGPNRVDLDVGALGGEEGLVDVGPVSPDGVLARVELAGLVLHLPKQLLGAAADADRVVDPDVVPIAVFRLLDERLADLLTVEDHVVLVLHELSQGGVRLQREMVHDDVVGAGDAPLLQGPVHNGAAPEVCLRLHVVDAPRFPQVAVLAALLQGEAGREERDQALDDGPGLYRLVEDALLRKNGDDEVPAALQPPQDRLHRRRRSLAGHAADPKVDSPPLNLPVSARSIARQPVGRSEVRGLAPLHSLS